MPATDNAYLSVLVCRLPSSRSYTPLIPVTISSICNVVFILVQKMDQTPSCNAHIMYVPAGNGPLSKQYTQYQYLPPPCTSMLPDLFCVSSTLGLLAAMVLG
ncbi:hypothetical protein G9A89_000463 [Geosiphon pyriformis]|nr:hypothetical protein G9A89_000463 [Geosiphon pyriformis]